MKTLNTYITELKGSASIHSMQKAQKMREEGIEVIDLAGGEPDFDTPKRIREAAKKALDAGHTHYTVGKGILPLRKKIAEKEQMENGILCTPDQVIVTPGGKYGIYMAIASVVNPGDEVLILAPYWVSYEPMVRACGGIPVIVSLKERENYKIEKQCIYDKISDKTKLLIINYPNNPTGRILHREEAEILKEIILETGIYVVSDEIYEKIVFDGEKSFCLASIEEIKDYVITVNGFSKCAAMTGWRIGYTIASQAITDVMYKLFVHSITGISTFIQEAAVEVFSCSNEIETMCKIYEERRDYLVEEISKIPWISIQKPEGTFYLWLKAEVKMNSTEFSEYLLEQRHMIVVPGNAYGEEEGCYVRICFACEKERLIKAIECLKSLF